MTYAANETSTESGRPVEVFEFTAGATSFFYTSAEDAVTLGAQTYTAVAGFQSSSTSDGPNKREDDFKIELPTSDPLAARFKGVLPGTRIRLVVKRFHRDDLPTPEVVQIFDGYIHSAAFSDDGKKTILIARTAIASVGKQIPRRTFQSSCNHVLYDPLTCKVDDTDPAFRASTLTVASQVGNTLTVAGGLMTTYADGFMNGGFVEILGGSDFRLIISHVANDLELSLPFSSTPTLVNVYAGCAHTIQVCKSKFDNVIDFGGFAFVPTKNPFETGVL